MERASRRRLLVGVGVGVAGAAAGCVALSSGSGTGTGTATGTPWADFPTATDPASLTGAWPSEANDAANTARTSRTGPGGDAAVRWSTPVGTATGNGESGPVVAGDTVFVGELGGDVHALDAASGDRRWTRRSDTWVHGTPAVAGRTVYLARDDHLLTALDATTGERRWAVESDAEVVTSPVVAGGRVFVGDRSGTFHALTGDGSTAWTVSGAGEFGTPAVADGTVVTADASTVYGLGLDGTERWTAAFPGPASGSVTVADGTVYAVSYEPAILHAFALDAGTRRWSFDLDASLPGALAVLDGGVAVGAGNRLVSVAADGTERWAADLGDLVTLTVVADGTVHAVAASELVALSADGKERGRLSLPAVPGTPMAVAGGRLFVKCGDQVVAVE